MGKALLRFFLIVLVFLFFVAPNSKAIAATCTASATGNWNTTSTWTCDTAPTNHVPLSTDDVVISSTVATTVTVDTAAVANSVTVTNTAVSGTQNVTLAVDGNSLTISSGGGLIITGGSAANRNAEVTISTGTLTVPGNISFSGTAARARFISTGNSTTNVGGNFASGGTLTTSGTGTINFNGGMAQTIGTYTTYNNIQINNTTGDVAIGGTTTFGGTLLVNTGTLNVGGFTLTVTGAATINSTLRISSTTGTKTFDGVTIANGGILNFTAAEAVAETGDLTINGTGAISGTTGLWTFSKVGGGTISGTTTSTTTLGSATFSTNYSSSIPLTVTGTTTVNAGITFTNNNTFTATGALSGATGSFTQGASSILNLGSTSTIGTINASVSTNEVHYISTAANQTIHLGTYHHLFIDKSGRTGTLGGVITVNGNLSVTAGVLADGGFQITGNATGNFTLAASTTLTLGTTVVATSFPTSYVTANVSLSASSTVNYNSNLAQTISNVPAYGNLTTTATGAVTKTVAGSLTVNGLFTNGTNNTFADGGFTITLKDGAVMTGTHTGTGKMLLTGGTSIHSVSGTGSYNNVELNDSNGVLLSGTTNIGGALTITSGIWDTDARTTTMTGVTTITGTLLISSITGAKTFGDITIASGGILSFTAAEAISINGDVTVNGTGSVTGSTGLWTFQKVGGGTIGGTTTLLTINGHVTFATPYGISIPLTVNNLTVNTGVTETNTSTITSNGTLGGAGTFTQSSGAVLNTRSITITTLNATAVGNTVRLIGGVSGTIKGTSYVDLDINKTTGFNANASGTVSIAGNLTVTSGTINFSNSDFTVTGTTDIYDTVTDSSGGAGGGSNTFGGLVTLHSGSDWTAVVGEVADFHFGNGLVENATSFVSSSGIYFFESNAQSITGTSSFTIDNISVTGIQLTNSSTGTLTSQVSLDGTGTFVQQTGATLNVVGTNTVNTFDASATGNTVNYSGTIAQTIKGATYDTLNVGTNTSNGVDLSADTAVNTLLSLGDTKITTSANKITLAQAATYSRSNGYVVGTVGKGFNSSDTFTYPIGDILSYTPVTITIRGVTNNSTIDASTTGTDLELVDSSSIDSAKSVNRYFTLNNNGLTYSNYDLVMNFVSSDIDTGANVSNMTVSKYSSGNWTILSAACEDFIVWFWTNLDHMWRSKVIADFCHRTND